MSLDFETKFTYSRAASTVFISKIDEVEVWVGWSDGAITSHTSLNLHPTLDIAYYFDNQTLTLASTQVLAPSALTLKSAAKWVDKVYVLTSTNITVVDRTTFATSTITLPFSTANIHSDLIAAGGKLWICDSSVDSSDQNQLWFYNLTTSTWGSVALAGKKQSLARALIDGLDGKIYVTSENDHSIISYDYSGSYLSIYKINRHPYKLQANQNKDVFVIADLSSTNNTISLFDQATNTAAAFSSGMKITTIQDDFRTGFMWMAGGGATTMRVIRSTQGAILAGANGIQGANPYNDVIVLTNQVTYDYFNPSDSTTTSLTIRPYLFVRTATGVMAYRATALKGVNSSQVLATAMIATGAQGYYGG